MSIVAIRAALETALIAALPTFAFAFENVPYTPTPGTPFGAVFLLTAPPEHNEISPSYTERGYLQVNLNYPLDAGPAAAAGQAQAIRTAFKRGNSFSASGVTTHIEAEPEIGPARIDDDVYFVPVRVRFYAHVTRS